MTGLVQAVRLPPGRSAERDRIAESEAQAGARER